MSVKLFLLLFVFTFASNVLAQRNKIRWTTNEDDGITWAMNCEFVGNNLDAVSNIMGEYCGMTCSATPECTHFVWTRKSGGTCELKQGHISLDQAKWKRQRGIVCGKVVRQEEEENDE
jgi:hypothetical protein